MVGSAAVPAGAGHPVWHLLVVAFAAIGVFLGIKIWEWWQARAVSAVRPAGGWAKPRSRLLVGVALASGGCAAVHAAVGPAHFQEATAFGVFFVAASALQASWAVLMFRRPGRALLRIGAIGNGAVLILWTVTRTVGLPIGPEIWRPEAVSGPDIFASLLEVTIVLGTSWLLLGRQHQRRLTHAFG